MAGTRARNDMQRSTYLTGWACRKVMASMSVARIICCPRKGWENKFNLAFRKIVSMSDRSKVLLVLHCNLTRKQLKV